MNEKELHEKIAALENEVLLGMTLEAYANSDSQTAENIIEAELLVEELIKRLELCGFLNKMEKVCGLSVIPTLPEISERLNTRKSFLKSVSEGRVTFIA